MHHIDVEFEDAARTSDALRDFGFDDFFMARCAEAAREGELPARIVEANRGLYRAVCAIAGDGARGALPFGDEDPEIGPKGSGPASGLREIEARPSGAAAGGPQPVAGDWALLRDAGGGRAWERAVLSSVLPRKNAIVRKAPGEAAHDRIESQALAANVDAAFIVMAAGRDWNPRRLERYLVLARESGVEPVVVISKADLADDPGALESEASGIAGGALCVLACAPEGLGLERLKGRLGAGKTAVFLGSSGAGKSTLLNALAGRELARAGEVRADDQRGRHTTTTRQLYRLPTGGMVIDSPGLREIQLWADEDSVLSAFPDIEALAAECRFRDCSHDGEPGCAVRAALESGDLDPGRYEGWRKLAREAAFLERRADGDLQREEERRWKAINKSMRGYSKERRALQGRAR
jgi:ribosome biogenesis GTPase